MGAGTDSEIAIRFGHFELLKKDIGHGGVVVLSGVNESLAYIGAVAQGAENRRGFHEVGRAPTTWRMCMGWGNVNCIWDRVRSQGSGVTFIRLGP